MVDIFKMAVYNLAVARDMGTDITDIACSYSTLDE
jgi:hypothetical protein